MSGINALLSRGAIVRRALGVGALALAGAVLAVSPTVASAQPADNFDLFVNHDLVDPHHPMSPQVQVSFDNLEGKQAFLDVTNPADNDSNQVITYVGANLANGLIDQFNVSSVTDSSGNDVPSAGPNGYCGLPPGETHSSAFWCEFGDDSGSGGIPPGDSVRFTLFTTSREPALDYASVWFNYAEVGAQCRPQQQSTFATSLRSGPFAAEADACTTPSRTHITLAKIDHHKHTAFFRFKARATDRFLCELTRNHKVMLRHSCRSPKPYANRLRRGQYVFYVWGVNNAGMDSIPASKRFTIK